MYLSMFYWAMVTIILRWFWLKPLNLSHSYLSFRAYIAHGSFPWLMPFFLSTRCLLYLLGITQPLLKWHQACLHYSCFDPTISEWLRRCYKSLGWKGKHRACCARAVIKRHTQMLQDFLWLLYSSSSGGSYGRRTDWAEPLLQSFHLYLQTQLCSLTDHTFQRGESMRRALIALFRLMWSGGC